MRVGHTLLKQTDATNISIMSIQWTGAQHHNLATLQKCQVNQQMIFYCKKFLEEERPGLMEFVVIMWGRMRNAVTGNGLMVKRYLNSFGPTMNLHGKESE